MLFAARVIESPQIWGPPSFAHHLIDLKRGLLLLLAN